MRKLTWRFILAALVFLTLSRVGLSVWQWSRVHNGGGLWPVLMGGWRIDLSLIAMIVALPALLVDGVAPCLQLNPVFLGRPDERVHDPGGHDLACRY